MVCLPTWMVEFYGKCIGKYTIHGWYGIHIRIYIYISS